MVISVVGFLWVTLWALISISKMRKGDRAMVHPVLLVTYIFLGLPLLYELLWGRPYLARFPGIDIAINDPKTNALYLIYICILFPVMYFMAKYRTVVAPDFSHARTSFYLPEFLRLLCAFLLILPILIALSSPDPSIYLQYAVSQRETFTEEVASHYALVSMAGRVAAIAAVALILSAKRITIGPMTLLIVMMITSAWLNGKRSAFAIAIACLLFAFWQRGMLKGRRLIIIGLIAVIGLGLFSTFYQDSLRSNLEIASTYEGFRLDYTRDSTIKLAIFSILNPDTVQVINQAQTLPLYFGQLIPSDWWIDKPMPYAQYITSAAFLQPPQLWGWGLTTSWFGEWVSNIGFSAFFIAPALLGLLCRWGDKIQLSLARALVMIMLVLLVVQHVAAFSYLVPLVIVMIIWDFAIRRNESLRREKIRSVGGPTPGE